MDSLRIRSCFCMSLYTAGIVIGCVEVIVAIVSIILVPVLIVSLFGLIANMVWLYGIYVKRHRLLLPSLILMTILFMWSLNVPIISLSYELAIYRYHEFYMASLVSLAAWLAVALCGFIWILKYSIYKYMVESTHGSHIDSNNC